MAKNKILTALLVAVLLVAGASAAVGDTWITYNKNTTSGGIDNNSMRDVEIASNGDLWLATYGGGVSKYDGTNWTLYKTGDGLVNNTTWDIDIDSAGNIWIATSGGLSKYDGTNFTNYTTSTSDISTNSLRDVYVDSSGVVWIGTYGDGLDKMDGTNWTNWVTSNSDIPNNRIWDIEPDGSYLWLGTEGGISKFDKSSTFTTYNRSNSDLLSDTCRDLELDSGAVWIATGSGLNKLDGTTWSSWTTADGMERNTCYDVDVDSSGVVYVGHNAEGVDKLDGTTWTNYQTSNSDICGNIVWSVEVETDSKIWFGTTAGVSLLETAATSPTAEFSGSPTSGDAPLTVNFTDSSTGTVTSWSWTFGDGGTSTAENPLHEYSSAGDYDVSLTVSGSAGSDNETKTDYISVTSPAPVPDFSGSSTTGYAPLTVTFTDLSTGPIDTWKWEFGDGNTLNYSSAPSSIENVYTSAGTYTVKLSVRDENTSQYYTETKVDYITVQTPIPPTAAFVGSPTSGGYPLAVQFTDQSTGTVESWSWDFGDDGTSTQQNPSHSYTSTGDYTVTLTVDGLAGSDDETKTDYITVTTPTPPTAAFSGSPTSGDAPLTVNFTNSSTGSITSYSWTFGDSGTSTQENPSHQYTSAGDYTVSLTVTGPGGSDDEAKTDYITVSAAQAPVAAFSGSPTSGEAPLTVNFTDQSTGIVNSWSWTFGDGSTSTQQNPTHQYENAESYTVSLDVSGTNGSDTHTKVAYIIASTPAITETWDSYTRASTNTGINSNSIRHVSVDSNVLWVGQNGGGLSEYDGTNWTNYKTGNSDIINNAVWDIAYDTGGNMWIATNGGVSYYDGTNFTNYTTSNSDLGDNNLRSVAIDSSGNVWFAAIGGVEMYDGTNWTEYDAGDGLAHNSVWGVAIDSSGVKWFATFSGVSEFDGTNWTTHGSSVLPHDDCYDVFVDSNDNVWVGTIRGIGKYDGTNWTTYEEENGMPEENCRSIFVNEDGDVWAGTYGGGVCVLKDGQWTQYTTTTSDLLNNTVWDIFFASPLDYWIGTNGGVNLCSKLSGGSSTSVFNIDISGSSNGVVSLPGDVHQDYRDVFDKYTKITASNGNFIHFLAQPDVSEEELIRSREIARFYLTDFPGSQYGSYKTAIANKLADRNGSLFMFKNESSFERHIDDLEYRGDEDGLNFQDLYATECFVEGDSDYMNNPNDDRDASFEEIMHLCQQHGMIEVSAFDPYGTEIHNAMTAARSADIWTYQGDSGDFDLEYYATLIDVYYGLWAHDPDDNGEGWWGEYEFCTRAAMQTGDSAGYTALEKFLPPYLGYEARIHQSFSGTFSLTYSSSQEYTLKSRYLLNATLTGSNNSDLTGNDQDNILRGNSGNNDIDGAAGDDTAVFTGDISGYTITTNGGVVTVTDNTSGRDGVDVLTNIECIKFADTPCYTP